MLSLTIGSLTARKSVIVDENTTTVRKAFTDNGIVFDGMQVTLNGNLKDASCLDKTLAQLGCANGATATLIAMARKDNA